jgi:hypothetical protein
MTTTQIVNHVYYAVCAIVAIAAALPPSVLDFIPAAAKPWMIGFVSVAAWLKSHWNLFVNPDGTPAVVGYRKQ